MFACKLLQEQIEWAVESGADYIVAETFSDYAEAELALQCIKLYGNGCTIKKYLTFQIGKDFDALSIIFLKTLF